MPPLNLLIKPASSLCNMRCRYCFYADVSDNREVKSYGIMNSETTETLIKRAFEFADGSVGFAFQGGEPTVAGYDYFVNFIELVKKYNTKNIKVSYSIQTNAYNVSDEMCKLLADNHFLAGVSLDGTLQLHDANRIDAMHEGTFHKVNETMKKFDEYGVDYNILCVVTENIARNISKVYNYFRSKNYRYIQFITHIDGFGDEDGKTVFSLSPKRYTSFMKTGFKLYYDDFMSGNYRSVRQFDNFVMLAGGQRAECCGMNGVCPNNMVIEADGSAYPCDFYVLDEWCLGNIKDSKLIELFESETAKRFISQSYKFDDSCRACRWYGLCRGGCRRYREPVTMTGLSHNKYCESYKEFFEYAYPMIMKMVEKLSR